MSESVTTAHEVRRKRAYNFHPFSEREKVVALYESGLGNERIAKLMGLDSSMVRQWLRRYRDAGLDALRLQRRVQKETLSRRETSRRQKDAQYYEAYRVFSTTLEPLASITRRFQLDYKTFKYHVEHFHPELVAKRARLKG